MGGNHHVHPSIKTKKLVVSKWIIYEKGRFSGDVSNTCFQNGVFSRHDPHGPHGAGPAEPKSGPRHDLTVRGDLRFLGDLVWSRFECWNLGSNFECREYITCTYYLYMGVSKNSGTPKSSILIGFSIINHPFWGTPIFGNTHMYTLIFQFPKYLEARVDRYLWQLRGWFQIYKELKVQGI